MIYDWEQIHKNIDEVLKELPYFDYEDLCSIMGIPKKFRTAFFYAETKKYLEKSGWKLNGYHRADMKRPVRNDNIVPDNHWYMP